MTKTVPTPPTPVVDGRPLPTGLDEPLIHAVVHGFYARIREDTLLSPIFNAAIPAEEWPVHLQKMCDFWSSMLLKTARYGGRPLPPHLAIEGLGAEHFRRWLGLFKLTVETTCPPEIARLFMDRALRVAHSFHLAVAFHRGEDTLSITPFRADSL